jgi:hypothetical protein
LAVLHLSRRQELAEEHGRREPLAREGPCGGLIPRAPGEKARTGDLKGGKKFRDTAQNFLPEFPVIAAGQRNPEYVEGKEQKIRLHLTPFFGDNFLSEITSGLVIARLR